MPWEEVIDLDNIPQPEQAGEYQSKNHERE